MPPNTTQSQSQTSNEQAEPTLEDLAATVRADPEKWVPRVWLNEVNIDNNGKTHRGSSLGSVEMQPLDGLDQRLIATYHAPLDVYLSLRKTAGGFGPGGFRFTASARAQATVDVPQQPSTSPSDGGGRALQAALDKIDKLETRLAAPPAPVSTVPTSPFEGALQLFGLVDGQMAKLEARLASQPKAQSAAPLDAQTAEALLRAGKEAAAATTPAMAIVDKLLPAIAPSIGEFFSSLRDVARARVIAAEAARIEQETQAKLIDARLEHAAHVRSAQSSFASSSQEKTPEASTPVQVSAPDGGPLLDTGVISGSGKHDDLDNAHERGHNAQPSEETKAA